MDDSMWRSEMGTVCGGSETVCPPKPLSSADVLTRLSRRSVQVSSQDSRIEVETSGPFAAC